MARPRDFAQVDVFSTSRYQGNPAVVIDGTDLTDDQMQRVARWTNQSETSFLIPTTVPAADDQARIFTRAGHICP
jgi:PhzF family phenazine biosynthesis protein